MGQGVCSERVSSSARLLSPSHQVLYAHLRAFARTVGRSRRCPSIHCTTMLASKVKRIQSAHHFEFAHVLTEDDGRSVLSGGRDGDRHGLVRGSEWKEEEKASKRVAEQLG